jgi:hypothetical protein
MGINRFNDHTLDFAQIVDPVTAVGDDSSAQSDVYDLKQPDPSQFKVAVDWIWTVPFPGAVQFVNVLGSPTADFSGGTYTLGMTILGDSATAATYTLDSLTGSRGTGRYVFECSNVGCNTDASGLNYTTVVCRYIKVAVVTVGLSSGGGFGVRIETN